jgi:hypothetical protein
MDRARPLHTRISSANFAGEGGRQQRAWKLKWRRLYSASIFAAQVQRNRPHYTGYQQYVLTSWEGGLMASFEELKAKYQSVLALVQDQQIGVKNLHLQDGKLFIKGTAPSLDAANKVWNEIKRINPKLDDITVDLPVDQSGQQSHNIQTYKVRQGDTLSKISKQFYGSTDDYMRIFEANKDQLSDPDKIRVGQELKIPAD